jgi:hypothetical protein
MRTIIKAGIVILIVSVIAVGLYALFTAPNTLVYSNVKITNISMQNWGDDFVYLNNGAVLRFSDASGLLIGHTYNVYTNAFGDYAFQFVS